MNSIRAWYESLDVDLMLAVDSILGRSISSDAALLSFVLAPLRHDLGAVDEDLFRQLLGQMTSLVAAMNDADILAISYPSISGESRALLANQRLRQGVLRDVSYGPGEFKVLVGDIGLAEDSTLGAERLAPLGQLQLVGKDSGQDPLNAWITFDPEDHLAPIYLASVSGRPELLAKSLPDLLNRL